MVNNMVKEFTSIETEEKEKVPGKMARESTGLIVLQEINEIIFIIILAINNLNLF